jgi:adenosylhomocysteine nucleosidase
LLDQKVGIVAALEQEVKDLLANSIFQWEKNNKGVYISKLYSIKLVISGIGKVNAVYAASKIMDEVDLVLMVGTSGGLNDEKVGDLYLSTEFVEHDMDARGLGFDMGVTPFSNYKNPVISTCSELSKQVINRACDAANIILKEGRTISGDLFLSEPRMTQQKRDMFQAQLVDMESAAVAKICQKEQKDFLALRYVSDNANHESATEWTENVKKSSQLINTIMEKLCSV